MSEAFDSEFIQDVAIKGVEFKGNTLYTIKANFDPIFNWPTYIDETPTEFKTLCERFEAHVRPLKGVSSCMFTMQQNHGVRYVSEFARRTDLQKKASKSKSKFKEPELVTSPWFKVDTVMQYLLQIAKENQIKYITQEAVHRFLSYDTGLARVYNNATPAFGWIVLPANCKLANQV